MRRVLHAFGVKRWALLHQDVAPTAPTTSLLSALFADPEDSPGSLGALRNVLSAAREINDEMSADDVVAVLRNALLPFAEDSIRSSSKTDPVAT